MSINLMRMRERNGEGARAREIETNVKHIEVEE